MRRSPIRRNWFYICQLLMFLVDVAALIAYSVLPQFDPPYSDESWSRTDIKAFTVIMVRLALSSVNELFLLTYGFYHTNTIFGTFAFQQVIYYAVVVVLLTERAYHIPVEEYGPDPKPWRWMPIIGRASCDALISITLWVMLLRTQHFKDRKLWCMKINIYDLADGTHITPIKSITWKGTRRRRGTNSLHAVTNKLIATFCYNSLFRRVIPVEKKRQVFLQHVLSLAAIALLVIRTVSEFRNSHEDLPTRTIVKPCMDDIFAYEESIRTRIFYTRSSNHQRVKYDESLNSTTAIPEPFHINISRHHRYGTAACNTTLVHTIPDHYGEVDWFEKHDCGASYEEESSYNFNMTQRAQNKTTPTSSANETYTLSIWMEGFSDTMVEGGMAPYLTEPIIPDFGSHTVYKTRYAMRRIITSSLLIESITGSDPTYKTVTFFPASTVSRKLIPAANLSEVSGSELVATGFIHPPVFLESSEKIAISGFKLGQVPTRYTCEITEDYRDSSILDIFSSIGGLLALLQGIHILLFGRPLFWGMFGAKAIMPFGVMGNLATKSFKRRLQERYHLPRQGAQANPEQLQGGSQSRDRAGVDIDMAQFLLDFVIDMGPASVPDHEEDKNLVSDSENEEECEKVRYGPVRRLGDIEGATEVTELRWVDSGTPRRTGSQLPQSA